MMVCRDKMLVDLIRIFFVLSFLMNISATHICALESASTPEAAQQAFTRVARDSMPSVVSISTSKTVMRTPNPIQGLRRFFDDVDKNEMRYTQIGLGSGVIVDDKGYILTNFHVVKEATEMFVRLNDGRNFKAKLVGADTKTDLAVIRIDAGNLPVIRMGDSSRLEVGQWAIAIGSPFGFSQTMTVGIISALERNQLGILDREDFIQTDAAINPGNSGGALLNISGDMIGLNTAIFSRTGAYEGIGFAIPVNVAKTVMGDLIKYGRIVRGWLGVYIQPIDDKLAAGLSLHSDEGVVVVDIAPGSPAEIAGLRRGDVIVRYAGKKVAGGIDLRNYIQDTKVGTTLMIGIVRKGKNMELMARITKAPDQSPVAPKPSSAAYNKLGLMLKNIPSRLSAQGLKGVVVGAVKPNSAAAAVGFSEGDLIVEVNQRAVGAVTEFTRLLAPTRQGDQLLMLVKRGQYAYYVVVEIAR